MLNWILASIAALLWTTAYSWYFAGDLRRWLWRRRNRRRLAEIQRAQAYAAWMRRNTTPRARSASAPPQPGPMPRPASEASEPPPRPSAVVLRFPDRTSPRPPLG